MLQRGRKSAANLASPSIIAKSPRLTAPSSLTTEERRLFSELIGACDSNHFRRSDLPLLVSYVQATLNAQTTAHDPKMASQWERSVRMQCTLATRLRLSPQSRIDPKTLGRQDRNNPRLRYPWEDKEEYQKRCLDAGFEADENEGDE
jgi:hypothetical protein